MSEALSGPGANLTSAAGVVTFGRRNVDIPWTPFPEGGRPMLAIIRTIAVSSLGPVAA
jgi:hypothetical protein